MSDFTVSGSGTLYLLTPNTKAAHEWVAEHIQADAQKLGQSIAIEHRYIVDIVYGIEADGLVLEVA